MKIDDKYKWLARDRDGELRAYEYKPSKEEINDIWGDEKSNFTIKETDDIYSFIRWVDEQPTSIEYVKEVIETADKSHFIRTLDEPEITEEQALNKLAESYPFSADGINAMLQAQLAGYSPVSTVTFFKGNEVAFTEDTFWEYMNDQYRLDKEELFGKLKENNYLKKHSIVELPVIPQFVADYIEKSKNATYSLLGSMSHFSNAEDIHVWIRENQETFARAWIDGYTIEKESVKTRQVLVKFFDNEEYKTELTEKSARELIEFLEANKK